MGDVIDTTARQRVQMMGLGVLASLAFYLWVQIALAEIMAGRALLAGSITLIVFFGALLALSPRVALRRAAVYALGQAVVVAALMVLASLRFDAADAFLGAVFPVFAALILGALPLPFFIAHASGNWRDYATLFEQAWDIVLRYGVGLLLIGAVWLLIFLSDLLLSLVGLRFIDWILEFDAAIYAITGAAGGFGLAVAAEALAPKGARLALMLLRPLLPMIVAVVAVFLVALPFRGLSSLFGTLSAGMTLMTISAVAALMVTAVVDTQGEAASRSRVLAVSARVMSGLMLVLGALAVVAVAQRVGQYGWTPPRLYAAIGAAVSLGYGLLYAAHALRPDWMGGIRRANVTMALGLIVLAALTLTPVLDAERLSTSSQMARFADGRTPPEQLDFLAFHDWGRAGKSAQDALTELSKQTGQEALAARIKNAGDGQYMDGPTAANLRAEVARALVLQPLGKTTSQAALLQGLSDYDLEDVKSACARKTGDLEKSCVMIVADFLPDVQGEEGLIALISDSGDLRLFALTQDSSRGNWAQTSILGGAEYPSGEAAIAVMRAWQGAPPQLVPAPIMQLPLGEGGLVLLP